ncbi:hypothetical protein PINS_up015755 [Pythium insidiosum]|nr:hypothetical protein PINS_up015755 [Pythium insidiosum]
MRIPITDVLFGDVFATGSSREIVRGTFCNQAVAIKRLTKTRRRDLKQIAALAQEARCAAQLTHERVVSFIGVAWSAPSDLCVVSEFMEGGSVLELLQQYRSDGCSQGFSPAKLKIALHVAHALTYLHSLDPIVLHRDIRSKNVLLTAQGEAKLTGFGLARHVEDDAIGMLTAGVGSALWAAPEVLRGEQYDEKADVYSFGVLLSELDTNELPFSQETRTAGVTMVCRLVAEGSLSVRFSRALNDPELKALGCACVSRNASERPTATAVLYRIHLALSRVS